MAEIRNGPRARLVLSSLLLTVSATLIAHAPLAAADAYQDWLRSQSLGTEAMKRQYQVYRSEQDLQFSSHLKAQWQEFQVYQGKVRDPSPKPKILPKAVPKTPVIANVPAQEQPIRPDVPAETPLPPKIEPSPPPPVLPAEVVRDSIELDFYGNPITLPFDPQWRSMRLSKLDPDGIAAFWDTSSATRLQPTLQAMAKARQDLALDDWGHVALWQQLAKSLQPDHPAERSLLLWYFLVKAGGDVRLGYSGAQPWLFVAVEQPVYAVNYTKVGERTYYALLSPDRGKSLKRFSTYDSSYPAPLQPLNLKSVATAFGKAAPVAKTVTFDFQGRPVTLKFDYDRRVVEYMSTFPQMDFELYFATPGSPAARNPLLQTLHQKIQGMSEENALNFLLAFVQKGFAYQTDEEQFGYEKYFYVEETLHYPYSDCEDRAVLYSWLVRNLLGLKTVGLHYPGHMTTAVAIKSPLRGNWNSIEWQGERYVIADPTYINASIGMAMPSYANLQPLRVVPAP